MTGLTIRDVSLVKIGDYLGIHGRPFASQTRGDHSSCGCHNPRVLAVVSIESLELAYLIPPPDQLKQLFEALSSFLIMHKTCLLIELLKERVVGEVLAGEELLSRSLNQLADQSIGSLEVHHGDCFERQLPLNLLLLFFIASLPLEGRPLFMSLSVGNDPQMKTFVFTQLIFTHRCFIADRILALKASLISEPRCDKAATESEQPACCQQPDLSSEPRPITHAPHHTGRPLAQFEVNA